MTLQEIFTENRSASEIISDLMSYPKDIPSWCELRKRYEPMEHPIVKDPTLRPKEKTKNGIRSIPAKIPYPAEKIATRRMVQMAFTIPVKRKYFGFEKDDKSALAFIDAIEKVYKAARIDGVNKERMKPYFAACEMATVWYAVETDTPHSIYGFETRAKIRCKNYSPMDKKYSKIEEADIYPLYDDYGDMIALSFKYEVRTSVSTIQYFDCFTADSKYQFVKKDSEEWVQSVTDNPIGKIPAIYGSRTEPIYEDIDKNREEIEFTNSRTSDVVKSNSAPIVVVKGQLIGGELPSGENGREAYQVEGQGGVSYLSSPLAIDQTTAHIQTQKQMISEITQLPDLSLESMKGLGAISGEARKTLLTDAQMKVGEEADAIIWFLDREFSVISNLLASINTEWKKYIGVISCKQTISAFIQNDKGVETDRLVKQVDGGLKSRRTAMAEMGDFDNVDEEIEQITFEQNEDAERARSVDLFEGAE